MNSVFIGTSAYGVPALKALVEYGMAPKLVVCQPDRPAGRNLKTQPQAVALASRELGLSLITPENINDADSIFRIQEVQPELLITASYGGLLGKKLRLLAPLRAINLHPSLLPRYRGATPIQAAILHGDVVTGTTIFRMIASLDAGPVIIQEELPIMANENHGSLHDRLAAQAARMLMMLLVDPAAWTFTPQNEAQATYCQKLSPADLEIEWQQPAHNVSNLIRALSPIPGAVTSLQGSQLKILEAEVLPETCTGLPGTIGDIIKNTGFTINCQDHPILVKLIQAAGKKVLSAAAFINGARIIAGQTIGKG